MRDSRQCSALASMSGSIRGEVRDGPLDQRRGEGGGLGRERRAQLLDLPVGGLGLPGRDASDLALVEHLQRRFARPTPLAAPFRPVPGHINAP